MLCEGHPQWDPQKTGRNVEGFKWDKVHEEAKKQETEGKFLTS